MLAASFFSCLVSSLARAVVLECETAILGPHSTLSEEFDFELVHFSLSPSTGLLQDISFEGFHVLLRCMAGACFSAFRLSPHGVVSGMEHQKGNLALGTGGTHWVWSVCRPSGCRQSPSAQLSPGVLRRGKVLYHCHCELPDLNGFDTFDRSIIPFGNLHLTP